MMKHTQKRSLALVVFALLAMAGIAWATTKTIATDYLVLDNASSSATDPYPLHSNLDWSDYQDTPVAEILTGGGSYTIQRDVRMNKVGGMTSTGNADGYTINAFNQAVDVGTASGALNLNGGSLLFQPTVYRWTDTTSLGQPFYEEGNPDIGATDQVLRIYDAVGNGSLTIDTTGAQKAIDPPNYSATDYQHRAIAYTGGTYLENSTLTAATNARNPFGPADSYNAATNKAGFITMGTTGNAPKPAHLIINSGVTTYNSLHASLGYLRIPELRIRTANTDVTTDSNIVVNSLVLEPHATLLPISINGANYVAVDSYTNQTLGTGTTIRVERTGTLEFRSGIALTSTTNVELNTDGAIFRTLYSGNHTIGRLNGGSAGKIGTLQAYGLQGTLTINEVQGNPIIDIPHYRETVSIPAGHNISLWGVKASTGVGTPATVATEAGTLEVRGSDNPLIVSMTIQNQSGVTDMPRISILDASATVLDARTNANVGNSPNRTYDGLNGNGQFRMTPDSGPAVTSLTLNPYIASNIYAGDLVSPLQIITLNAAPDYATVNPAISLADRKQILQAFAGSTTGPASGTALTYAILAGVMEYYTPAAIRNANEPVNLNVGSTPSGVNSTVVFRTGQVWDLRAANATNPTVTAQFMDDATIKVPATINNFAYDDTTFPIGSLGETPAALRLENFNKTDAGDLNIEIDATDANMFYHATEKTGYIKLVSRQGGDVFLNSNTGPYIPGVDGVTNVNVSFKNGQVPTADIEVFVLDGVIYIGYPLKTPGSGGGGGGTTPKTKVTLDMTYLVSADLSSGTLSVVETSGDKKSWNLSNTDVTIVVDENDPSSVKYTGNVFDITFKYPTIIDGASITVTFENAAGQKTSYTTTAKTVGGVSVLTFPATGLPSGTYKITLASPTGRNPYYTGTIAVAFAYTAPKGLIFTLTSGQTSDSKGITAFAEVTSNDVPLSNIQVIFTLTDTATGKTVGSPKTEVTANGKTPTVTFGNLSNGTYSILATPSAFNVETESIITITASTPSPDPDPTPDPDPDPNPDDGKKSSGSGGGGCDSSFGILALALVALPCLRRKIF